MLFYAHKMALAKPVDCTRLGRRVFFCSNVREIVCVQACTCADASVALHSNQAQIASETYGLEMKSWKTHNQSLGTLEARNTSKPNKAKQWSAHPCFHDNCVLWQDKDYHRFGEHRFGTQEKGRSGEDRACSQTTCVIKKPDLASMRLAREANAVAWRVRLIVSSPRPSSSQ